MHTTTVSVELQYSDEGEVGCAIHAKSTDPQEHLKFRQGKELAAIFFAAFCTGAASIIKVEQLPGDGGELFEQMMAALTGQIKKLLEDPSTKSVRKPHPDNTKN